MHRSMYLFQRPQPICAAMYVGVCVFARYLSTSYTIEHNMFDADLSAACVCLAYDL